MRFASGPRATPRVGLDVSEGLVSLGGVRKRIAVTRTLYARNPAFTRSVLAAYRTSCCVCGHQMGLVQAAHIIPHGHPDSVDQVVNGLALCVEHHKLYDDGLLLPTEGQRLILNPDRVEYLRVIKQDSGIDKLKAIAAKGYTRPKDKRHCPNEEFLGRGVRIRLGTDRPPGGS
jgi:putative restriction endonuclease